MEWQKAITARRRAERAARKAADQIVAATTPSEKISETEITDDVIVETRQKRQSPKASVDCEEAFTNFNQFQTVKREMASEQFDFPQIGENNIDRPQSICFISHHGRANRCRMEWQKAVTACRRAERAARKAALQAEASDMKKRLEDAESKISALTSDLRKSQKLLETVKKQSYNKGYTEGTKRGVKCCRQQILATRMGQKFLDILRHDLVEDYLKTPVFMVRIGDAVAHFVIAGVNGACRLLNHDPTLLDEGSVDGIIDSVRAAPCFPINPLLKEDSPWWLPAMKRAAYYLLLDRVDHPLLPAEGKMEYPVVPFVADPSIFTQSHTEEAELRELKSTSIPPSHCF